MSARIFATARPAFFARRPALRVRDRLRSGATNIPERLDADDAAPAGQRRSLHHQPCVGRYHYSLGSSGGRLHLSR